MNILNLYGGLGGNRKKWKGHKVTMVELDPSIAQTYQKIYKNDKVIVGDCNTFLQENYHLFDYIWASPPCQSHGQYRHNVGVIGKGFVPLVPDATNLYGLIIFLKTYFNGLWSVENTKPYYKPLIEPTIELQRHLFWSNFPIENKEFPPSKIRTKNKISDFKDSKYLIDSGIKNKRQVLRNCVNPKLGKYILNEAVKYKGMKNVSDN